MHVCVLTLRFNENVAVKMVVLAVVIVEMLVVLVRMIMRTWWWWWSVVPHCELIRP